MNFSANLGFLWTDRSLPEAILAAKAAGFSAVECHWPYDTPPAEVQAVLQQAGLPMLGLNTVRGNAGENGLAALPNRRDEAIAAIDQAIAYADAIDAKAIHVMAGIANGAAAHASFIENLRYACSATTRTILIEPLNRHDAPGYFLNTTDQARNIIDEVAESHLKLMFDCYHVGRSEGDVGTRFADLQSIIGHVQFASVPNREQPSGGELNYTALFQWFRECGWVKPLGAEYKTHGDTEATLGWMGLY